MMVTEGASRRGPCDAAAAERRRRRRQQSGGGSGGGPKPRGARRRYALHTGMCASVSGIQGTVAAACRSPEPGHAPRCSWPCWGGSFLLGKVAATRECVR